MGDPSGSEDRDDEARWAAAEARLDTGPTVEDRRLVRRTRRRSWTTVAVLFLVVLAVGLWLGWRDHGRAGRGVDVAAEQDVLGVALTIGGFVLMLVGGVGAWRAGAWRAGVWRGSSWWPLVGLRRDQRRSLRRQVEGRRAVDPARLRLTRGLADRWHRQAQLSTVLLGVALLQAGRAARATGAASGVLAAASTVAFLVMAILVRRLSGQAGRFLREHPDPGGTAG